MSRTPVREAINRLVAEGLLTSTPHCSVRVRELTTDEVIEMFIVRGAIESEAARWAALRVTDEEIALLAGLCDQMDALPPGEPESIYQGRELDAQLHRSLVEFSGVRALASVYREHRLLQLHMFGRHWTRLPGFQGALSQAPLGTRHTPIVAALASHDPDNAYAAVKDSVREAIEATRGWVAEDQGGLAAS